MPTISVRVPTKLQLLKWLWHIAQITILRQRVNDHKWSMPHHALQLLRSLTLQLQTREVNLSLNNNRITFFQHLNKVLSTKVSSNCLKVAKWLPDLGLKVKVRLDRLIRKL